MKRKLRVWVNLRIYCASQTRLFDCKINNLWRKILT